MKTQPFPKFKESAAIYAITEGGRLIGIGSI